jgi:glyoxylase-like metal-dependent hydrolase (beta-lactamase superfamily II)
MIDTELFTISYLELGPMENFVYLITDKKSGRSAIVDPAWEVEKIIQLSRQQGSSITDILLTHSHHDHINGIQQVLDQYDAQLHLTKAEAKFWDSQLDLPNLHHGGDVIELGDTKISILHTPGHTPGSACYYLGDYLIAGDTMFVYGCGRCDLRGGDPNEMYNTLKRIETDLPGSTITLPGHNYSVVEQCTLDEQKAGNPFMHFDDSEAFREFRMHTHDKLRHSPYGPVKPSEMKQYHLHD